MTDQTFAEGSDHHLASAPGFRDALQRGGLAGLRELQLQRNGGLMAEAGAFSESNPKK